MIMLSFTKKIRGHQMNDFTKKELLEIYGLLEHHYCDPKKCIDPNTDLLLKIQSMIDNYCEHEWIENQHNQSYCSKCDKNDN